MFERLGLFAVRRRTPILWLTLVFFVASGALGGGVIDRLSDGGFDDPDAEATVAATVLRDEFGQQTPNLTLLVVPAEGAVDAPEVRAAGLGLTRELEQTEGVEQVLSYWATGDPALKSRDGHSALIYAVIPGTQDEVRHVIDEVSPAFTRTEGLLQVQVTGFAEVYRQMGTTIEKDLVRAEMIAFPITLIALVFVFGSLVAAGIPLLIGGLSIVGTFLALTVITEFTEVSIFALNLTTALGLGLAIDYSLFVVSRYREELRRGLEPHDAVRETVRTAGRTVAFSGFTVAISLAALLVFPMAFLRSFAYAGAAVVALASIFATVFLPAFLAVLGRRVDSLRLFKREPKPVGEGAWHRMAMGVMRRPIPIATIVVAFLLFLGAPFLGIEWGQADYRALPESTSSRRALDQIGRTYDMNAANALAVTGADSGAPVESEIDVYARRLSALEGVHTVQALTGTYAGGEQIAPPDEAAVRFAAADGTWLSVIPAVEPFSGDAERVVNAIRSTEAPFDVQVAGVSAEVVDTRNSVFDRVPLAGLLIGLTTFILLFLMFGGLLVPVKAIFLNLLSLTATFGAIVFIFQDGHFSEFLDFTPTGLIEVTTPILMFCIAFGLSMDYEVFLLSRIKEEHDAGLDNTASVARGLEHTGRIVTAAALLLAIIFISFSTSGVTFIKMMGIGLTLAVVMDASLVRATLVPAFMRLAGEANWWAPRWMRHLQQRLGFSESAGPRPSEDATPEEVLG